MFYISPEVMVNIVVHALLYYSPKLAWVIVIEIATQLKS